MILSHSQNCLPQSRHQKGCALPSQCWAPSFNSLLSEQSLLYPAPPPPAHCSALVWLLLTGAGATRRHPQLQSSKKSAPPHKLQSFRKFQLMCSLQGFRIDTETKIPLLTFVDDQNMPNKTEYFHHHRCSLSSFPRELPSHEATLPIAIGFYDHIAAPWVYIAMTLNVPP